MEKKMLHESLLDHQSGQLQTGAGNGGGGRRDHPGDTQTRPVPAGDRLRHDVLTRVARISGALNQRLAL